MIAKKAILSGLFSMMLGAALLAMPARAMAHDWGHGGGGWHHDNGEHRGWNNNYGRGDGDGGRGGYRGYYGGYNQEGDDGEGENRGYYGGGYQPNYGYGYNQNQDGDEGGYGGNWFNRPHYGSGYGMINRRHPNLMWACDGQGHHCHWAPRGGGAYGYGQPGSLFSGYGYNQGGSMLGSLVGPILGGVR